MGLFQSGSLTFLTRLFVFFLSLGMNILLARTLGPAGRGVYTLALLVPSMMFLVANFGISFANVYYIGRKLFSPDEIIAESGSLSLILGGAAYAVTFIAINLFGRTLLPGVDPSYVLLASLALPLILLFNLIQAVFQGLQRFIDYNVVVLVSYGSQALLLAVALLALRQGTLGAVAAWTLSSVPTALATLYLASRVARLSIGVSRRVYRALLRFGIVAYLSNLTQFFNFRLDQFLVNLFAGTRDVGLYAVGVGMAETVWYLSSAAGTVLAPRVAATDSRESDRVTASMNRVVLFLTVAAAIILALLAPLVIRPFFGSAFADSVWAVWLLLPGVVTLAVAKVLSGYLLGRNQVRIDLAATAVGLAVTLALDVALIPRFGFAGAAVASSFAYTATMLVDVAWVIRHSSISPAELFLLNRGDLQLLRGKLPGFRAA